MQHHKSLRSPLGRVRGLGSARAGTEHFIRQRVSALALMLLIPCTLYIFAHSVRMGYGDAQAWLAQPVNAIVILLTLCAAFYHMRLGMQVIIEDYIQKHSTRSFLLILNSFLWIGLSVSIAFTLLWIAARAAQIAG